ncbi:uncharacterized protein LOC132701328 [Cylas formicarius]|uniref:uncharacterized protein LOC132701328 n=1 Tax=Cylas formicarius TaxID=197179 RepID=UPI002958A3FA|nr:uncharacterized protein LOC132701328 [Cylas formicarius]
MSSQKEEFVIEGPEPGVSLSSATLGLEIYSVLCRAPRRAVAMIDAFTNSRITYGEITQQSFNLAEALRRNGYVGQTTVMAICSENNLHFYVPVFAAAYNLSITATINPGYTPHELAHTLSISRPRVVFCTEGTAPKLVDMKNRLGFIEKLILIGSDRVVTGTERLRDFVDAALAGADVQSFQFKPLDGDSSRLIAYILCSSGTTGLPKGVMLSHRNIMLRITHSRDPRYHTGEGNTTLGVLPMFHAFGFLTTLESLLDHKTVVVLRRFDEDVYLRTIQDHKIRYLYLAPPMAIFLAKTPKLERYDVSSVRQLTCGAAPLSELIEFELKKRFDNPIVRQGYGLTEATMAVCLITHDKTHHGSCGQIMSYMKFTVKDPETGRSLGPNQVGEICLKGLLVMLGYYENEEATKESFTSDGWLRTGDIGYYDEKHYIYVIDRLKELIKYKGFQVAPAELEALIVNHPKVLDAGVVGVPDELVGERPLAFVVKKEGEEVSEKELRDYVADLVSPQKRLSGGVVFVSAIPKNPSGKILRRQLRDLLESHVGQVQLEAKLDKMLYRRGQIFSRYTRIKQSRCSFLRFTRNFNFFLDFNLTTDRRQLLLLSPNYRGGWGILAASTISTSTCGTGGLLFFHYPRIVSHCASAMIGPDETNVLEQAPLGEYFFRKLDSKPDKNFEFLVDLSNGVSLTHRDFLQYSVNLTLNLENLGVKESDIVGVFAENCWQSAVLLLAAWNLGASVAFINPNFIKSELYHSLRIKEPKILFTTTNKLDMIDDSVSSIERIVLYDKQTENGLLGFSDLLFHSKMDYSTYRHKQFNVKETVACILSSSGTTGFPKAVMLTHDNLKYATKYLTDPYAMDVNPETVTILYLPLFHILGIMIFIGVVSNGKQLLMCNKFKPEEFLKTIQNHRVTKLFVVPPILQFLAKSPSVQSYDLTSLNHVLCGGAPAGKEVEVEVTKRLKNVKVRQIYGMTEVTGAVTTVPPNEARFGSVGKPFGGGLIVKIVDPETNLTLGPNQRGEICFKGPPVMKGYMKNEAETKNCIDASGFLHSGDVGYFDADGYIYVVDRIKELIKYKAFQVAPAELERLIIKHDGVKDVGVVGKPDDRCGELPTAFVVKQPGEKVTEQDILDFVSDNFSHEKHLHGGVVFVDDIPKTASGKILRRELRKLLGTM